MKKADLIKRLQELIDELKAEKPRPESKPGWVISRWAGGREAFMIAWDVWTIWIKDAYVFAKREVALVERDLFEGLNDGRVYNVVKVVAGKNGKALRRTS